MSYKIIIVDFDDSFTHNIASVLFPHEPNLKVMSHDDFFRLKKNEGDSSGARQAVILGPGPGHPEEFRHYFSAIKELRNDEDIFVMGICLGHQIMGLMDGLEIKESIEQMHGQSVPFDFRGKSILVQRYNSLALHGAQGEINMRTFERGISYQFHPESVGTESNILFFQELLEFVRG